MLTNDGISREEIREYLNPIYDLERLLGKISYQTANPRDLIALQSSLKMLKPIRMVLEDFKGELLQEIYEEIDPLEDIYHLIDSSIQ